MNPTFDMQTVMRIIQPIQGWGSPYIPQPRTSSGAIDILAVQANSEFYGGRAGV